MSLLEKIFSVFPSVTITVDGKLYLTRYYVFGRDFESANLYVHHFHSSDQFEKLHSHPWKWGLSFVFWCGYVEEKKCKNHEILSRKIKAPAFNFITNDEFHRVDLLDEHQGAWSLFVTGKRTNDWYFMDRLTGEKTHFSKNPEAIP